VAVGAAAAVGVAAAAAGAERRSGQMNAKTNRNTMNSGAVRAAFGRTLLATVALTFASLPLTAAAATAE